MILAVLSIVSVYLIYITGKVENSQIKEFGCTFDDASYNLNADNFKGKWPIEAVYGDKREGAMNFQNEKDFKKFHEKVVEIRNNIFKTKKYVYNSLEPFVKFYKEYSSSKDKIFRTFFRSYVPKFPSLDKKVPGNLWNGLIWIYKDLVQYDKRVEEYFTMATCDQNLKPKDVDLLVVRHSYMAPSFYNHEDMVGVIRFSIEGKRFGYLVIDVTGAIRPMPVIMVDEKDPLNHNEVLVNFQGQRLQYTLRGKPESPASYIQINYLKPDDFKGKYEGRIDVIYVRNSLCSFVSIEKVELQNPFREILQFDESGRLLASIWVALQTTRLRTISVAMQLYNSSSTSHYEASHVNLDVFADKKYTNPFLDKIIDQSQISRQDVYDQLSVMNDIQSRDQDFVKGHITWYMTESHPKIAKVSSFYS